MGIRCLVSTNDLTNHSHLMITEGLRKEDLPAAVGYFVLNQLIESFARTRKMPLPPSINISVAEVDASVIAQNRNAVRKYSLEGAEFGEIFEIIRSVETNDRSVIE